MGGIRKSQRAMKGFYSFGLIFLVLLITSDTVWAQKFPAHPVNLVVNYAPGGTTDNQAKILGDKLGEVLGQPFIRVHKPGGGGTLGASFVARAKPDGYTILVATDGAMILAPLLKKVDSTYEDFTPIGIFAKGVVNLYVKKDSQYKSLSDFIAGAKKNPGQLKVSSMGKFTHADFVIETLSRLAGIKLAHIPCKGGCAEAMTLLLGDHVAANFCSSTLGQLEAGTVINLATADHERSSFFPDVPTFKELGYPLALPASYSFVVPRNTPKEVIATLSEGMKEVYKKHGAEITEVFRRLETFPNFLDSPQSVQELKRSYEILSKTV
ncbi:MAG: putative Bug-like extracytoplasmic solute binding receptor, family, partial [Deltaproteobacteria bacterium]|nr:putative Bug-like extracytoplasmic solute binding receptor, family [Deltaproteobacteria bacterium]